MALVEIQNLSKAYGGVRALEAVSFSIGEGEVHALCGENGAGKSTLIKVLGGVVTPDEGKVDFLDEPLGFGSVYHAEQRGIAVIHQESVAFPHLNAVDNLFVGRELRSGPLLDRRAMRAQAQEQFERLGERIDLRRPLLELPLAQRQMVAIGRALMHDCRLLIMDEPTASLSDRETQVLFENIRRLRAENVTVLYVSHRLREIAEIADRVTVLRDGRWVSTDASDELTEAALIERMVGRSIRQDVVKVARATEATDPALSVRALTREPAFRTVSFDVHPGEVVGLAGLVGAGRSEVARCIFGVDDYDSGMVEIEGQPVVGGSVRESCRMGIALVPEDRQHEGLVQALSIRDNLCLPWLERLRGGMGRLDGKAVREMARKSITRLGVKFGKETDPVASLSGGNQQKVVLGKWLAGSPRVLILDEPTRGVDVGAKEEVYDLVEELAQAGVAILLISSDLPEVIRLSHRVLVMAEGQVAGELAREEISETAILRLALPDSNSNSDSDRGSDSEWEESRAS